MAEDKVNIKARCHCGQASFTFDVKKAAFPLKSSVCHCNTCRHVSGQMFASLAIIPDYKPDLSGLSSFITSANLTRYFCPTCGAHVGDYDHGEWEFATGMLDSTEGRLDRVQLWIEDTKDGGASIWLPDVDGLQWARHVRGRDTSMVPFSELDKSDGEVKRNNSDRLYGKCRCGDVQFYVTRPSAEPPDDSSRGRWWAKGDRYISVFDPCTSCRLCTGFEIVAWTFVPMLNIFHIDGTPFSINSDILKTYSSSPPVRREFCGRCGATVFFRKLTREVDVVDIAAGLFESPSGVRAEEFLAWEEYDMEDAQKDAIDQAFSRSIGAGLDLWLKDKV